MFEDLPLDMHYDGKTTNSLLAYLRFLYPVLGVTCYKGNVLL